MLDELLAGLTDSVVLATRGRGIGTIVLGGVGATALLRLARTLVGACPGWPASGHRSTASLQGHLRRQDDREGDVRVHRLDDARRLHTDA